MGNFIWVLIVVSWWLSGEVFLLFKKKKKKNWQLVVIRCHSFYHMLSLVVTRRTARLSFHKQSVSDSESIWNFLITLSVTIKIYLHQKWKLHDQPSRGVLTQKCSENILKIYRRTLIPKCDFNKVVMQIYWNYTST